MRGIRFWPAAVLLLAGVGQMVFSGAAAPPNASRYRIFVGDLSADSALIAWGTTDGPNTIGRSSSSHGSAELRVAGQRVVTDASFALARGLQPDTEYDYEVLLDGQSIGKGRIRTWPRTAKSLSFFVIGDFGNASREQRQVADAMMREFERRAATPNPVRFVLTTGDNIYAEYGIAASGDSDIDWGPRFFGPYEPLLKRIPFRPSLGNHDGNESERRGDLPAYLDNFFFPGNQPARYYRFSFGGLADFFALDSTENTAEGPKAPQYLPGSPQHQWLTKELAASKAHWKIPYIHHPPFSAGPRHEPSAAKLGHFLDAFAANGVKAVFSGHEHNFQASTLDAATRNIRFFVSGAGGELRAKNVRKHMAREHIAAWAPQCHFLSVEIDGGTMKVTPLSWQPVKAVDPTGKPVPLPIIMEAP